jgi:hypothetical protein
MKVDFPLFAKVSIEEIQHDPFPPLKGAAQRLELIEGGTIRRTELNLQDESG